MEFTLNWGFLKHSKINRHLEHNQTKLITLGSLDKTNDIGKYV
ncbi:hypothetical protein SAMN05880501_10838 [Ureibacillus xyleni]|uniref:Uncharacterized protein n=1 Tax=Ureibacillus xyleni TaxID=614648 RepID=A0A285T1I3_9BACL|nr:hypothetical protein SAMN05880501_10838 [Ureibacillus xyleni]